MTLPGPLTSLLLLGVLAAPAAASPRFTIRLATAAPDGTPWAREVKAFAREIDALTHGEVEVKWYLSAIAGNELEAEERIRRGQLDGVASGGMLCQHVAPSMRVLRVLGVFQNREEAGYALARLNPALAEEAHKAGYVWLGTSGLGPDVLFLRNSARTFAEIRKLKLWRWDLDEVAVAMSREMGLTVVPLPVEKAARAFDNGEIDGFIGVPSAALAFQWFSRAHHLLDLRTGFLSGCLVVTARAFERLPIDHQQTIRAAAAKLAVRFNDVGRQMDDKLLGGLFEQQGLKQLPVPESLRAEFFAAARAARERMGEKLVPAALLQRVLTLLADYRAEHVERPKPEAP